MLSIQTNGIFELQVTNDKETVTWTIDMKKTGTVYKGKAQPKADVTIILSDDTLIDLADGKVCSALYPGYPEQCLIAQQIFFTPLAHIAQRPESFHDWQAQDQGQHDVGH